VQDAINPDPCLAKETLSCAWKHGGSSF